MPCKSYLANLINLEICVPTAAVKSDKTKKDESRPPDRIFFPLSLFPPSAPLPPSPCPGSYFLFLTTTYVTWGHAASGIRSLTAYLKILRVGQGPMAFPLHAAPIFDPEPHGRKRRERKGTYTRLGVNM